MNCRIILMASYDVFIEQAEAIKHSLLELGFSDVIIQDSKDADHRTAYDINIHFKALRSWNPCPFRDMNILFQTEELWNRRERGVYFSRSGGLLSSNYERVLEMYDENCKIPQGTKNVVYCPVGYSPAWERNLPEVEEDIDVLFHGALTVRRLKYQAALSEMGLNVYFTKKKYGLERDKLVMRSKIDINIKASDNWSYGPMHCLPAMANKQFMLSERANGGYGPFSKIHIAEYNGLEDCKKTVKYWLDHDKERKDFAQSLYVDMVKTCNFTPILQKALGPHQKKGLPRII